MAKVTLNNQENTLKIEQKSPKIKLSKETKKLKLSKKQPKIKVIQKSNNLSVKHVAPKIKITRNNPPKITIKSGGDRGPKGDDGKYPVVFQPEAPTDTELLWVDTDDNVNPLLPEGGTTGQVLGKLSDTDYHTGWVNRQVALALAE